MWRLIGIIILLLLLGCISLDTAGESSQLLSNVTDTTVTSKWGIVAYTSPIFFDSNLWEAIPKDGIRVSDSVTLVPEVTEHDVSLRIMEETSGVSVSKTVLSVIPLVNNEGLYCLDILLLAAIDVSSVPYCNSARALLLKEKNGLYERFIRYNHGEWQTFLAHE